MLNFRVDDLDASLAQLEAAGVRVDPKEEDVSYGRFAWIWDPEGNGWSYGSRLRPRPQHSN
jgi:predicted enzyme related to lactoylglutathione lyase